MSGTLPPDPRTPLEIEVDDLLATAANLTERPFPEVPITIDPEDWEERTREYDARILNAQSQPVGTRDKRTTEQMLTDARFGLDIFLNEASIALMVGHPDLTEFQRAHLTRIVTFIEALGDRFDRVTRK